MLVAVAALIGAVLLVAPVAADPPVITVPSNITAEATSTSGAPVSFTVTSSDASNPTCSPSSGTTFSFGPTTVTCSATNTGGETGTGTFQITVQDTTAPSINAPSDISTTTTSQAGKSVSFSVSATDLVDGAVSPSCSPSSGSNFPTGTTTVTCSATDGHSNTSHASFQVTVTFTDTTPPVITVPSDISASTTSPSGTSVSYSASANDNVDGSVPVSCSPSSGSNFGVGTTTVNCSASDSHGNTGHASFHVTVTLTDATPPVITVPNDISTTTTVPTGKSVTFSASATDNIDGPIPVNCSPGSGANFAVGTTTVNCSATDAHGNSASKSFSVTVTLVDTTPPVITVPNDISTTTTTPSGTSVPYSASANDNVDGPIPVNCSPASGGNFPVGTTTVTCTATDAHGNAASKSFHVTVTLTDTTPPVITVPADISTTTTVPAGKTVTFSASATDNIDGPITPTCAPASGATFPVATTTVTCSATDAHHNTASKSFTVTVTLVDTTAPVVNAPADMTKEATSASGAVATFTATAHDNIDGDLVPTCVPASGSTFPIGNTLDTCTATDSHGNKGTDTFHVIVQDTTKPAISVPGDITATATSSLGAAVTFAPAPTAHDTVDGDITPSCTPGSGSSFALGTTKVTCTATDKHNNSTSDSFNVTVKDTGAPVIQVPPKTVIEATAATGAVVTFTVTATDAIEGGITPVTCTPASGATFPLGTTHVACSAQDSSGNVGTGTFDVVVQDTTPPRLNAPNKITISTPDGGPLPSTQTSIAAFLASPQATDLVDGKDAVTNNAPASFPVGTTTITFSTRDKAGNAATATSAITVVYQPSQPPIVPPPSDTTPPPDPANVSAKASDRKVVLTWAAPAGNDLDHYIVEQSLAETTPVPVYTGTATTYTAGSLTNGRQYRFVVVSVDKAGNQSTGAVVTATPAASMLVRPADGATIAALPTLAWKAVPSTSYYNVQLYRMPSLSAVGGRKILSAWPTTVSLPLTRTWKYNGASQQLLPGIYRWFVWPGVGPRADGKYGALLGSATFVVKKLPAAPAKPPAQKKLKPKPKPKAKPKSVHK